ncbi:MAG: Fe-S cluster assembly protein SufD [Candidatus Methylomirabilota bacterium]|nr:MAG: Fe-S cluster assembly protein SufD [candidate division NC10 bacterium]
MLQVAEELERYQRDFERFERNGTNSRPEWIRRIQGAAFNRFVELGFPTTRIEEWKYTDVSPIAKIPFLRQEGICRMPAVERLESFTLREAACAQLVFVDGHYAPDRSFVGTLPQGVMVSSLASVLARDPARVEPYLARYAAYRDQAFVALNTAFMEDGAFVAVPEGTIIEAPIHALFISSTSTGEASRSAAVSYPRNLIVMGAQSQARVVESHIGLEDEVYCTNAVTEIIGGEHAAIDYYKVQRESEEAFCVGTVHAQLGRSSTFSSHAIDLGGALVRNNLDVALEGDGAECDLNGLYMVTGRQHVDHHTRIDHTRPHSSSRQLYKGILDGRSRGVFNGKIVVHPAAHDTDARQVNKNLLLSEEAVIDSKPQLEIFNNDVKCTHGTTIGQHDQDAMFYLRSRGIDPPAARSLLTYAFASELLGRIKVGLVRSRLEALLLARLGNGSMREGRS